MLKIHHCSSGHDCHSRGKSIPHNTHTLAAGPDVKLARLKPTGWFRLIHLFTTLTHTDQTLCKRVCAPVCVHPSLRRMHTCMPAHNQLSLMQPIQTFGGLRPTLLCAVGEGRVDSLSFSLCLTLLSLLQCHPGLAPTQNHIFKLSHHATPRHTPSPAAGPWLKPMTSNFPNCQKPSHREKKRERAKKRNAERKGLT